MNLLCDLGVLGFGGFLFLFVFFLHFLTCWSIWGLFVLSNLFLSLKKEVKRVGFFKILKFATMLNTFKAL